MGRCRRGDEPQAARGDRDRVRDWRPGEMGEVRWYKGVEGLERGERGGGRDGKMVEGGWGG